MPGEDVTPKYQETPVKWISARTVVETVKAIVASGREAEFLRLCDEASRGVVILRDDNNFLKDYLAEIVRSDRDRLDRSGSLEAFVNAVRSFPTC